MLSNGFQIYLLCSLLVIVSTQNITLSPTNDPTEFPSTNPSIMPSYLLSFAPSYLPTYIPTEDPSEVPTAVPTTYPSYEPSLYPTNSPSSNPTEYPTNSPSSEPTGYPTYIPTPDPSFAPTLLPSNYPSFCPSSAPTSNPTDFPSPSPSTYPSNYPTFNPTLFPTYLPSSLPTQIPTAYPSSMPTSLPTSLPTSSPTFMPTAIPSSFRPTGQPTGQPSGQPSAKPSIMPTSQPSSIPSAMPSTRPTNQPTAMPSSHPTSNPTSNPTSKEERRNLKCGECQSYNGSNICNIFSENVYIICDSSCSYSNFSRVNIGPNSVIKTTKDCQLSFQAYEHIAIDDNTTISAQAITLSTNGYIEINGTLTTFKEGPTTGPGSPLFPYFGASYGGSGGRINCTNKSYFTNTDDQIGNISVIEDINSVNNPTFGSGGGFPGSGLGGGRIILNATLHININGKILAEGGNPNIDMYGAGSGGSIIILANSLNITKESELSVEGGVSLSGGHGGGGRIAIYISNVFTSNQSDIITNSKISIEGGGANNPCTCGSSGTLFVSYQSKIGIIFYNNKLIQSQSVSYLNYIPDITKSIIINGYSNVLPIYGITLPILEECALKYTTHTIDVNGACTLISINNSTLLLQNSNNFSYSSYSNIGSLQLSAARILFISSCIYINQSDAVITSNTILTHIYSTIYFSNNLYIETNLGSIHSPIYQVSKNNAITSGLEIFASINMSISTCYVENINITSIEIVVIGEGIHARPNHNTIANSCFVSNSSLFTCIKEVHSPIKYNNTVSLFGQSKLSIIANIYASNILLCTVDLYIDNYVTLSTSGFGCSANTGYGAGINGGGGGNAGAGGNGGFSNSYGGIAYSNPYLLTSGSGGSCTNNTISSYGGGIIAIRSTGSFVLYGYLDSSGMNSTGACGSGAGGTVYIDSGELNGHGYINANGGNSFGNGGAGVTLGGGFIYFGNMLSDYSDYYFYGTISVSGGIPVLYTQDAYTYSPSYGSSGSITYPVCEPGYGGSYGQTNLNGDFCSECPVGQYSTGYSSQPCSTCTNAPTTAYYTNSGSKSSQCDYNCQSGYVNTNCVTPFQNVIQTKLDGIYGFIGILLGGIFILVGPLIFYRLQKKYGWFESNKRRFRFDIFSNIILHFNLFKSSNHKDNNIIIDIKYKRKALKLSESDLPHHVYRLNLIGSNHFSLKYGGSWRISESRPIYLRSMLDRKEYSNFADHLNKLLYWNEFSIEAISYYISMLLIPPIAPSLLTYYRYRKAVLLIDFMYNYNYVFFKNNTQRNNRNSLRLGISPDYTLAYIDFLYDEEKLTSSHKPISIIGQINFPVVFKFAGLGTYFNPYYIDTNDIILQALSQTSLATSFIDEAWIAFVVEFNAVLRTVYCDNPKPGIIRALKFLQNNNITTQLGGLTIELCIIKNTTTIYDIDKIRKLSDLYNKQFSFNPSDNTTKIEEFDKFNRNTFILNDIMSNNILFNTLYNSIINKKNSFNDINVSSMEINDLINSLNDDNKIDSTKHSIIDNNHNHNIIIRDSIINDKNDNTIDNKETNNNIKKKKNYFISNILKYFMKSNDIANDYNFNQLNHNFDEIYHLLIQNKLCLGIKVSHPKVNENFINIQDEDYLSDDEIVIKKHHSSTSTNANINRDSILDIITTTQASNSINNITGNNNNDHDNDSPRKPSNTSIKKIYGRKASSMEKFYNITENVEREMKGLTNTSSNDLTRVVSNSSLHMPDDFHSYDYNYHSNTLNDKIDITSDNSNSKLDSEYIEFSIPNTLRDSDIRDSDVRTSEARSTNNISIGVSNKDIFIDVDDYVNKPSLGNVSDIENENLSPINIKKSFKPIQMNNIFDEMIITKRKTRKSIDMDRLVPSAYQIESLMLTLSNNLKFINISNNLSLQLNNQIDNKINNKIDNKANQSIDSRIDSRIDSKISSNLSINPINNDTSRDTTIDNINVNNISTAFYLGYSLHNIYYYRLFDGFYGSLRSNIIFGSNVYPVGTRKIRILLEFIIFTSSIIDFIFVATITTFMYCLGPDPTSCKSHYAIVLMYSLWPGSLILSPISGIVAIVIGPSILLTRIYACWCRLSMISVLTILMLYFHYLKSFTVNYYVLYYVIGLVISRSIQVLTVDLYTAHLERARFTSGWDGLTTSLQMTKDNRIDMKY